MTETLRKAKIKKLHERLSYLDRVEESLSIAVEAVQKTIQNHEKIMPAAQLHIISPIKKIIESKEYNGGCKFIRETLSAELKELNNL